MKSYKTSRNSSKKHQETIPENTFLEDLEDSLMAVNYDNDPYGLSAFQNIYNQKKTISARIQQQRRHNMAVHQASVRAKQRIVQVQQLNDKVEKQGSLLKNQIQKINEVHTLSKILMMEKILKLQRETEDLERKRNKNYQMRAEKHRASLSHRIGNLQRLQRNKHYSLKHTKQIQEQNDSRNYQAWKNQKEKVDQLRADKQRRRRKSLRIEEYKRMIAQKNYQDKLIALQNTIESKEGELHKLKLQENDQQRHFMATKNITTDYMNSFFATETI